MKEVIPANAGVILRYIVHIHYRLSVIPANAGVILERNVDTTA